MKKLEIGKWLAAGLAALAVLSAAGTASPSPALAQQVRLPEAITFEPNRGQSAPEVGWIGRAAGQTALFSRGGAEIEGRAGGVIHLRFSGGARAIDAADPQPGVVHYLRDQAHGGFVSGVPTYARLAYRALRPGIDAIFHGREGRLELDFEVAAGASPEGIGLGFGGARVTRLGDGAIEVASGSARLRLERPAAWQELPSGRAAVAVDYVLRASGELGFRLGRYDRSRPLLIDPVLVDAGYLGGSSVDAASAIAVDAVGNVYVAGRTSSSSLSIGGPLNGMKSGLDDAFVIALSAQTGAPMFTTFLGGSLVTRATAIAVGAGGVIHLAGHTSSPDFPIVGGAQPSYGGAGVWLDGDAFYARIAAGGASLSYSTFLGGSADDVASAIALDGQGGAWLTGHSSSADFPLKSAFQAALGGDRDAFVTHIDAAGAIASSSYLGGMGGDDGEAIGIDGSGRAWIGGTTGSVDFPTKSPFQAAYKTGDGFVATVGPAGALAFSSFLGGMGNDAVHALAVDGAGNAWIAGESTSMDFPSTAGALQPAIASAQCTVLGCPSDAFVARVSPGFTLAYATLFGGESLDAAYALALAPSGGVLFGGRSDSLDLPVQQAFQTAIGRGAYSDGFMAELSPDGKSLAASSYFGGLGPDEVKAIAVDGTGRASLAGQTSSKDLPAAGSGPALGGVADGFFARLAPGSGVPLAFSKVQPSAGGDTGTVTVVIEGSGFRLGTSLALSRAGSADIPGQNPAVGGGGGLLAATFDLHGAKQGKWDIAIKNPDGTKTAGLGAFTVVPGEPQNVLCVLVAPPQSLYDRVQSYDLVIRNVGNVDAIGMCILVLPGDTTWSIEPPPSPPIEGVPTDAGEVMGVTTPLLPPGQDFHVDLRLHFHKQPDDTGHRRVRVWALPGPGKAPGEDPFLPLLACLLSVESEILNIADIVLPIKLSCLESAAATIEGAALSNGPSAALSFYRGDYPALSALETGLSMLATGFECLAGETPVGKIVQFANLVLQGLCAIATCADVPWSDIYDLLLALAKDPNALSGPLGAGAERFVRVDQPLDYEVEFENDPSATAPAQAVVVTVPLDPALDLATFSFGAIRVADRVIAPPPGATSYEGQLDLRPTQQVVLELSAKLDEGKREARWVLQAIDPGTGGPPQNPFLGFLPPNKTPPEGVGLVHYRVSPAASAKTGDPVSAQASIVFDTNAPIATKSWVNTIDRTPPQSSPPALGATSPPSFMLVWTASDEGSGVADVRIEVAKGSGPFEAIEVPPGELSHAFEGEVGETYRFHTLARDQVDNREPAYSKEVSTRIVIGEGSSGSSSSGGTGDSGGCGCRAASCDPGAPEGWLVLAAAAALGRRMRKRATPSPPARPRRSPPPRPSPRRT